MSVIDSERTSTTKKAEKAQTARTPIYSRDVGRTTKRIGIPILRFGRQMSQLTSLLDICGTAVPGPDFRLEVNVIRCIVVMLKLSLSEYDIRATNSPTHHLPLVHFNLDFHSSGRSAPSGVVSPSRVIASALRK